MKVLLVILIYLGGVLTTLAFFVDLRMPVQVHTTSAVSDGTASGTRVISSHDQTIQAPAAWLPRIGLVLDIAAIIIVAVLLWK